MHATHVQQTVEQAKGKTPVGMEQGVGEGARNARAAREWCKADEEDGEEGLWGQSAAGTAGAALSRYFMVSDTLVNLNVASNKIGSAKPESTCG